MYIQTHTRNIYDTHNYVCVIVLIICPSCYVSYVCMRVCVCVYCGSNFNIEGIRTPKLPPLSIPIRL